MNHREVPVALQRCIDLPRGLGNEYDPVRVAEALQRAPGHPRAEVGEVRLPGFALARVPDRRQTELRGRGDSVEGMHRVGVDQLCLLLARERGKGADRPIEPRGIQDAGQRVRRYAHLGTYVHKEKTKGDDEAICILEFENQALGMVECSWGKRGGMFDRAEIYGEGGVTYADLHMGNALPTYSEYGFGYAVEKAPTTAGWSYPVFEEHWNYGIPQEMRHFARCVRGKETLQASGEDGRVVMQTLYAAYASAGAGRKIKMPYTPGGKKPIDEWLGTTAQ